MATLEEVTRTAWSERAERVLSPAFHYSDELQQIAAEVKRDNATLWEVNQGQSYFVTRIEDQELVIVAIAGSDMKQLLRDIYIKAWNVGFSSIRFHTRDAAVLRYLREFSPEPVEYVMRIFPHGRKQ